MNRQILFDMILLLTCVYAWLRGDRPERCAAVLLLAADGLTILLVSEPAIRFRTTELGIVAVDTALLAALWWLAVRSTRWWPLFLAGLQLDAVACHWVRLLAPDILPRSYFNAVAIWAYPMLFLLGVGAWRHNQRQRLFGMDPPWKDRKPLAPST